MTKKIMKWMAGIVAVLMVFSCGLFFPACGGDNFDSYEYQLVTYCIGHSEWGLLTLYDDGSVVGYGRMIQDLSNYGMEGYQVTRTFIYGTWSIETDTYDDTIKIMEIKYDSIEDYDSGTSREYSKTLSAYADEDGNFTFNDVTIPMYMPEYSMLYDVCSTDTNYTYFLDREDFVEVEVKSMDAFFDEMDELRSNSVVPATVVVTFEADSIASGGSLTADESGKVYAYLYDDGTAEVYSDYFPSTGMWSYSESAGLVISIVSTDGTTTNIDVTIDGTKASFSYVFSYTYEGQELGGTYSFTCDDISAIVGTADESGSNVAMVLPVATFEASSGSSTLYAYLYNDGTAEINNEYFASTGTWTWNGSDTTFTIANDNGNDTYSVTVSGSIASFTYTSSITSTSYTFTCSDITALTAFAKGDPVATFSATKTSNQSEYVYAYLYYDCTAKINNDYFSSTGTWSWDGTATSFNIANDNGTDTYTVTITNNTTASFSYSSYGMSYSFSCSDISALIAFASQATTA